MKESVLLRYFFNEKKARKACDLIKSEGFESEIIEDKFNETSLDKFGMRRRFKVVVKLNDYNKIAEIFAKKLRGGRIG